jgi:hypothetical protein
LILKAGVFSVWILSCVIPAASFQPRINSLLACGCHVQAVTDSTAAGGSEKKKYYRTVPGFPGMMVEFDEPEEKRIRGEVVWWKVLLLTMGVGLMFSQATVLVSLFYA